MAYPTLNVNEIFSSLNNMIISQVVFPGNIKGVASSLVDKARVEGSLYGDTKLYISTDALESHEWGGDAEAANLLALDRPKDPEVQAIVLNKFRQIRVTTDDILSKRAFMTENVFSEFTGVLLAWLRDTKRVYDGTLYAVYFGSTETNKGKQIQEIDLRSASSGQPLYGLSGIEKERMEAMLIAQGMADLMVEMKDVSRDFNDYGQLRSYADEEIKIVWNSKFVNKIRKVDLPTIFHKDNLIEKFEEDVLPSRYFGRPVAESDIGSGKIIGSDGAYDSSKGTLRAKEEFTYNEKHYFPGDALATSGTYVAVVGGLDASQVYIETSDVICKIVTEFPPFMSAFSIGSEFYNPRSHTRNHYLTFGFNTLQYLKGKPFITVKAKM